MPYVFMGHPFSTYAKFSVKLTFLTSLLGGNVTFSENFVYIINE